MTDREIELTRLLEIAEQRAEKAEGAIDDYALNLNECRERIFALEKVAEAARAIDVRPWSGTSILELADALAELDKLTK